MSMKSFLMTLCASAAMLAISIPAFPEETRDQGQGKAIVTILPAKDKSAPVKISQKDLQIKVNGRDSSILHWTPFSGNNGDMELVLLMDDSARANLGLQFDAISKFIRGLGPNAKAAIAYMNAGRAMLAGPLSTDHAKVADELRLPGGLPYSNASPYFCLSNLAQHWPSKDLSARREVVMITNGVDSYYPGFDPQDPYLRAAIRDSMKAGIVVYSIYVPDRGREARYQSWAGQNLLAELTRATGGYGYWDASGRMPVSLSPYFDDIAWRLQNQYQLGFQSQLKGKPELQSMNLKVGDRNVSVYAPEWVFVTRPGLQ